MHDNFMMHTVYIRNTRLRCKVRTNKKLQSAPAAAVGDIDYCRV